MMRKLYSAILIVIILFSCTENKSHDNNDSFQLRDYNQLLKENMTIKPKSDTIALGFFLREKADSVENHIKKLIEQDKLKPKTTSTFSLVSIEGYPYEIFLSDSSACQSLLAYSLHNNSLATLTFFISMTTEDVINGKSKELQALLERKYSHYQSTTTDSSSANLRHTYYWFDGYKKITLAEMSIGDFVLEYSDIRIEAERRSHEIIEDSIKAAKKKAKIENSREDLK